MAQPTRSDGQVVRRRLSHNNLRRKKWRRRQPRAERKRPRRSGNFSALTFGVLVEHPIFFSIAASCCSPDALHARAGQPTKRGRHTPGRRARRQSALANRTTPQSIDEGRNSLWRRRRRAERKRRRRRDNAASWREGGRAASPFFVYSVRLKPDSTESIAAWFRPRSERCGSHPTAECDRRPRCRSPRGQTRCSARPGAVAVNA